VYRQTLLLFLACCLVGCGDSTSPTPCGATPIDISVSGGLTPTITWAAECRALEVAVYDPVNGFPLWHITADTRSIPTPVVYGVAPAGAKTLHAAEPLQSGAGYGVFVAVLNGPNAVGGFTP
jgi:hypothetical protein